MILLAETRKSSRTLWALHIGSKFQKLFNFFSQFVKPTQMPMPSAWRIFFFTSEKNNLLLKSKISLAKNWSYEVKLYFSPAKFNFSSAIFFFAGKKKSSNRWYWQMAHFFLKNDNFFAIIKAWTFFNNFRVFGLMWDACDILPRSK